MQKNSAFICPTDDSAEIQNNFLLQACTSVVASGHRFLHDSPSSVVTVGVVQSQTRVDRMHFRSQFAVHHFPSVTGCWREYRNAEVASGEHVVRDGPVHCDRTRRRRVRQCTAACPCQCPIIKSPPEKSPSADNLPAKIRSARRLPARDGFLPVNCRPRETFARGTIL